MKKRRDDAVLAPPGRTVPAHGGVPHGAPSIAAAAALSFLKETKGIVTWTRADLAKSLQVDKKAADQAITVLEMQGYVKPAPDGAGWMTTAAGEEVAGAKKPRFELLSVERALETLRQEIEGINRQRGAEYQIVEAVAFGDFLTGSAKVQAADVGIRLSARKAAAPDAKAESAFLRAIPAPKGIVHIRFYEPWMSRRWHRRLLT